MKKTKTLAALLLALALTLSLTACGGGGEEGAQEEGTSGETQTLVVGATPSPHAEMLEFVKPMLAEQGIELEIVEFTDYVLPNTALTSGDLDANFFQHQEYLDNYNENNGTELVSAGKIHFEPLGIYPGKTTSLDDKKEGMQIAVPNDVTNEARALQLLESLGFLTLDPDAGMEATPNDIVDNPYNVSIVEMDAAAVARVIGDVDFAVVNGNFALDAGIIDTVLTTEDAQSDAAQRYPNVVAVMPEDLEDARIQALVEALTSEDMRGFIEESYGVVVIPVF